MRNIDGKVFLIINKWINCTIVDFV